MLLLAPVKCWAIWSLHLVQMLWRAVAASLARMGSCSPCSTCCSTACKNSRSVFLTTFQRKKTNININKQYLMTVKWVPVPVGIFYVLKAHKADTKLQTLSVLLIFHHLTRYRKYHSDLKGFWMLFNPLGQLAHQPGGHDPDRLVQAGGQRQDLLQHLRHNLKTQNKSFE